MHPSAAGWHGAAEGRAQRARCSACDVSPWEPRVPAPAPAPLRRAIRPAGGKKDEAVGASRLAAPLRRGTLPVPGAAGPDQLLRVDLIVIGTTSDFGNIICHPNYLLSCLPHRNSFLPSPRAVPCPGAWQRSLTGRQQPRSSQAVLSVNSLPQDKAFLYNQPGLLSHQKELHS